MEDKNKVIDGILILELDDDEFGKVCDESKSEILNMIQQHVQNWVERQCKKFNLAKHVPKS